MVAILFRWSLPAAVAAVFFVGCAPKGGSGITDEVIEIEEIEMAPAGQPAGEPTADSGAEARREVDAAKAAADKAIEEASQSIEPPPQAEPPSATPPQAEPTAEN
jgi:hypothetical protein